ncbi:VacJ family lipoprotein [Permianibacter sp. IMCC34836]|uniref:MlaA family lipoprotein n=1 Tax=Permianibacter fluminis TaxID=2738515 RepID=UPI0015556061|nr:VacJ family lipoprotein [Permianibacter fluminis]NQD38208.1 VacJ family lipoprotein [Permianibacter fluminis]
MKSGRIQRVALRLLVLAASLWLAGCASTTGNPVDPYESFNRSMYSFNKTLDSAVLKPTAKAYDKVVPSVIDESIDNALSNIGELGNIGNALLQAKFKKMAISTGRLLINSTFGLAGLFDPATPLGLAKQDEDFGQTLAHWGVGDGPYLMLPLLGPSTARDIVGRPVDSQVGVSELIEDVPTRNTVWGLDLINTRQALFPLEGHLEEALDEYAFVRDAYLQRRHFLIYDGNPPLPPDTEDCDPGVDDC